MIPKAQMKGAGQGLCELLGHPVLVSPEASVSGSIEVHEPEMANVWPLGCFKKLN